MLYIFLCLGFIALIFSVYVRTNLLYTYKKYSKIKNKNGVVANILTRNFLDILNLKDVEVSLSRKKNKSYFDLKNNVINLKNVNFNGSSIYDIAVSLSLVSMVVLYREKRFWFKLRRIVLLTTIVFLFLFSFITIFKFINWQIYLFGIILFLLLVFSEIITVFVSFNVCLRVVEAVSSLNMLDGEDIVLVKKVLRNICFSNFANILDGAFFLF